MKNHIIENIEVYHGSPESFKNFDTKKIGKTSRNSYHGWGLYFTSSIKSASRYAFNSDINNKNGYVYIVDIKANDSDFLVWNKKPNEREISKISRQAIKEKITTLTILNKMNSVDINITCDDNKFKIKGFEELSNHYGIDIIYKKSLPFTKSNLKEKYPPNWSDIYEMISKIFNSDKEASLFILRSGFKGFKYVEDEHTPPTYVMFDHSLIKIISKEKLKDKPL